MNVFSKVEAKKYIELTEEEIIKLLISALKLDPKTTEVIWDTNTYNQVEGITLIEKQPTQRSEIKLSIEDLAK